MCNDDDVSMSWSLCLSLRAAGTQSLQKDLMNYRRTEWRTSKYLSFYSLVNTSKNSKHRQNSYKNTLISTFIAINMKRTKIEMFDQSDEILQSIVKEKKSNVQKIIDDLSSCSSKYSSIRVSYCKFKLSDELRSQQHISFSIFQLFIFFIFFQIMTKHININVDLKRNEVIHQQKSWHDVTKAEIEAFIDILFYMSYIVLLSIRNYWNIDSDHVLHVLVFNSMSIRRWKQIKKYLKIFNLLENVKIDSRDFDWWKKLDSLTSDFRKISKTHWFSDNHVSINEQLIKFKKRSCHIMQMINKTIEIEFKIYNFCQENYFFDFLFSSKIWNQDVRFSHLNCWFFAQRIKINETKTNRQLDFSNKIWKFTSSFFLIIQLCKSLSSIRSYELFLDNFFINARFLKVLKTMNIEICEIIKIESDFFINLVRLRTAITKKKHWKKMKLMIIEINKKMNIDKENILCMIWVNLNIVQFMIIMHTIDDLKKMTYKNVEKRHEIFNVVNRNSAILIDETWKISFSIC